jgi:WhiB family redox-sensing transcriptional regulator
METFAPLSISRHARCSDPRGSLTGLFFSENPVDILRAKAICMRCSVRELCLEAAIERGEPFGVWGGQQLFEGEVVIGRRGRGRPRRHPLPSPLEIDEVTGKRIVA